jgi:hypothetical protein
MLLGRERLPRTARFAGAGETMGYKAASRPSWLPSVMRHKQDQHDRYQHH